ncbi:hypothetical protein R1flu_015351 [Riccia fluitans]|uniref:Uncharacterized protein n=1 Tax=Riccia fluitans TaxID=41844 RepID=A0ABD1YJ14_9MARC
MGRAPCCDKANVKKGPWSPDEDAKLKAFIDQHGTGGNWITLPSKAGLKRCGKSCRLRWINYLRPDIKHGNFTEEEESMIYKLHANIGSRWSLIAGQLPGRTDNDIKNYWNTRLKKKLTERNLDHHHLQMPASKFQRSPSQQEIRLSSENNSKALDHAVTTSSSISLAHPCKPHTPLNVTMPPPDNFISPLMKPHQYLSSSSLAEFHSAQDIVSPTSITPLMVQQQQQQVETEDPVVVMDGVQAVEVTDHLLIWPSHPSPSGSSASSVISTDRNTYPHAAAGAANSDNNNNNSNNAECSVYSSEEHSGLADSDALLPVLAAGSPSLLIHNSIQPHQIGGDEVPALDFSSKLGDHVVGGLLVDDMMRTPFEDSCQNQGESALLTSGGGVKGEEFNFDREDPNWWSMITPPHRHQQQQQRTLLTTSKQQQQQHQLQQLMQQQQNQQYLPAQQQQQYQRYEESLIFPGQLSLDPSSMQCCSYVRATPSWNHPSSGCNALLSGMIGDYSIHHHQSRYAPQLSWPDAMNWQETR